VIRVSKGFLFSFSLIIFLFWTDKSISNDIKDQVVAQTELDEIVVQFCQEYCIGNERRGYIKDLRIEAKTPGKYHVSGMGVLQNRQVLDGPSKFVLYDHDVILNVDGTLDKETCRLRIDNVLVENDFHSIFTNLLKSQGDIIGREEHVPDCKRFFGESESMSR